MGRDWAAGCGTYPWYAPVCGTALGYLQEDRWEHLVRKNDQGGCCRAAATYPPAFRFAVNLQAATRSLPSRLPRTVRRAILSAGRIISGVSMAASLVRLGDFLYCAIWTIAGILLFEGPPLIFAYCGFFSPLTKTLDLIGIVVSCPCPRLRKLANRTNHDVCSCADLVSGRFNRPATFQIRCPDSLEPDRPRQT
jgi:hypothetical protein